MVREEDQEKEIQDAGKNETTGSGSRRPKKTGRTVSSAQERALPPSTVLGMDEEFGYGGMRVVPVQDADPGAPAQALQEVEITAKDPVGGSSKENGKRQGSVYGPGPASRRTVHRGGPRIPAHHEGGKQGGARGSSEARLGKLGVLFLSLLLSLFLSGQARRGQGELLRAAGGLIEVAADGTGKGLYINIVMIQ